MVVGPIDFEGLVDDGQSGEIPDGYRDLNWINFSAIDDDFYDGKNGYDNVLRSGEAVGYVGDDPASILSPDPNNDFDFDSGYFAGAWNKDLKVIVKGFDDGEKVAREVFYVDRKQTFIEFGNDFNSVDEVKIKTKGGYDANPNDPDGRQVAVDDLSILF